MADTRTENTPTCPSCGYSLTEDDMLGGLTSEDLYALAPDEGRTVIRRPSCDIEYHCQGGYRPEYTTALDEDDL